MNEPPSPRRIAILGATSQIARDLIISFSASEDEHLHLFARRPEAVAKWLVLAGLAERYPVDDFSGFTKREFDAVINFVGVGDPAQAVAMGASIFETTLKYDMLVLDYLHQHPECRYLFLSSGAVYGPNFDEPVDENSKAAIAINHLQPQDWYAVAKLYAECRHRALSHLPIVDIRVFNYFSHTQDVSARFLITDILRAIQCGDILITSSDNIVRDYIGPDDFYQMVALILAAPAVNDVVDCYTKAPVDKMTLLSSMNQHFGLSYEVKQPPAGVNATGMKMNYFSKNRRAKMFKYSPVKSSLEGVLSEVHQVVSGWR
jgi:nucleoside-diphosphate-sugar epimerase